MNKRVISLISFVVALASLGNCRNDELSPGGFLTPTGALFQGALIGTLLGTAGGGGFGGNQVPGNGIRNTPGAGGVMLFGESFRQPAVWRSSNGTNWEKANYTIPGCVSAFLQDGSNNCTVVAATFNGFSKFYILVRYNESRRGSDNVFRDTTNRLWLGTGTFLSANSITFKELNLSSLGVTTPTNLNFEFRMAANSAGVVLRTGETVSTGTNTSTTTYNYCASIDDGGSWACATPTTDVEFVENLDSATVSIGRALRWTNPGSPTATGDTRTRSTSAIRIGNRSFLAVDGVRFTDDSPSTWNASTTFTAGTTSTFLGNSLLVAGANSTPFAVNRTFSNNTQSFTLSRSDDNGVTWTTGGAPNTGITYKNWNTFNMVFANGKYIAVTEGTESDNRTYIRILETSENPMLGGQWRTVCGQSGNATCP